jgi:hypothetical protein
VGQLEIKLRTRIDRNGDEYLIGSATDIPAFVDLRDATFIVFYPRDEDGPVEDEDGRPAHATLVIRKYQPPRHSTGSNDEGNR